MPSQLDAFQLLADAVIEQAKVDMVMAARLEREGKEVGEELKTAQLFLTAQEGAWGMSRELWTMLAGRDSDRVRDEALKLMARI